MNEVGPLAPWYRLTVTYQRRVMADTGGHMSYGTDFGADCRRLRGRPPP